MHEFCNVIGLIRHYPQGYRLSIFRFFYGVSSLLVKIQSCEFHDTFTDYLHPNANLPLSTETRNIEKYEWPRHRNQTAAYRSGRAVSLLAERLDSGQTNLQWFWSVFTKNFYLLLLFLQRIGFFRGVSHDPKNFTPHT